MAIPSNAKALPQPMDPADILDWSSTLTQGPDTDTPVPALRPGEDVASFTLALSAEAVAAGLRIRSDTKYPDPTIFNRVVTFWLDVDPAMQSAPVFSGNGLTLAIELTFVTTSNPPRQKQRTLTVQVAQQ